VGNDANPDSTGKYGLTPLSQAAGNGNARTVRILLERGEVNPQASDKDGRTPLSSAAENPHEGIVRILRAQDVSPNTPEYGARTPL